MKIKPGVLFVVLFILVFSCCGPIPDYRGFASGDVYPPVFLGIAPVSPSELVINFDSKVALPEDAFKLVPHLGRHTAISQGSKVSIMLEDNQVPGRRYRLEGFVKDESGNSMSFITEFYGFNPTVPGVVINEFTTQGSGKHPDLVEFFITESGDMAGMAFYHGVREDFSTMYVFPQLKVRAGDYVLLHCKPQGIPEEIDESLSITESGGYDASDLAWDLWLKGGTGLSGNNGVISVYKNPGGEIADAVLYSSRTSESDSNYCGFGSASLLSQAQKLAELSAWSYSGEAISPKML